MSAERDPAPAGPAVAAVRRARGEDQALLADSLASAFYDDPVISWAVPDDAARMARARRFFALQLLRLMPFGEVYVDPALACGALWAPPDRWRWPPLQGLRLLAACGLARLPRLSRGFRRVEEAHPERPPHYYLAVLGTAPAAQGRGLGSAAMRPILEDCDANGIGAYLESSKERNIAFYARHGFKVTREVRLPGGPLVWPMWRDPA
jgi:ribosomal protein S18 acetylase RimI-like enzyme